MKNTTVEQVQEDDFDRVMSTNVSPSQHVPSASPRCFPSCTKPVRLHAMAKLLLLLFLLCDCLRGWMWGCAFLAGQGRVSVAEKGCGCDAGTGRWSDCRHQLHLRCSRRCQVGHLRSFKVGC